MNQAFAGLAAAVDLSRLPSAPQIVSRLLQALEQDRPASSLISRLVMADPALCLRALAAAAAQGPCNPDVAESLVDQVGFDLLRVLATSAASPRDRSMQQFQAASEIDHALLCAEVCRRLAHAAGYAAPEEACIAGLIHNIGQTALVCALGDRYVALLRAGSDEAELVAAEESSLDGDHAALAAELVDRWRLPSFLGDALRFHHAPVDLCVGSHLLVRILRAAVALVAGGGDRHAAAVKLLDMQEAALERLWSEALASVEQLREELGLVAPAPRPADAAAGIPGVLRVADSAELPELPAQADAQLLSVLNDSATRYALAQSFTACRTEDDVLRTTARMAAGLAGWRVPLFFIAEADKGLLRGRCVSRGCEAAEDLRVAADAANNFVGLAWRNSVVMRCAARGAVIDRQVLRLAGGASALAVPLMTRGQCVAVMIADVAPATDTAEAAPVLKGLLRLAADLLERQQTSGGEGYTQREIIERYRAHARRIIHEAGNPLGIIKNYLKVLALRLGAEHGVQQELSILNEEIDRVTQIIRRFGEPPSAARRGDGLVDINEIIKELMTAYGETLFGTRRVRVELALDPALPPIRTEEDSLKQALLNLFKNAAEAMPGGGQFVVATSDNINHDGKTFVEIRIKDNGPGIPPELMQKLYQPVASAKGEGHEGLGLSIVLSVVHRLGGAITCRSQIGQGTVFQIFLPRAVA